MLEKQSRFVQKVQTDLNTDHVYYATPAHNDVLESHRLQDFTKVCTNYVLYVTPVHNYVLESHRATSPGTRVE